MLFKNSENQIYSGDKQGNDAELTEQEYQTRVEQEQNTALKVELQRQIDELDKRRIRALAEPQIKDEITSQTWLEYYTEQIQELRAQISGM